MRKLIVQQWVTVDNIAAKRMGLIDSVDTMILGASTYAQTKDDWPNADDQGGTARSSTTSPIPRGRGDGVVLLRYAIKT